MAFTNCQYRFLLASTETVTVPFEVAGSPVLSVPHAADAATTTLSSGTTPPATTIWSDQFDLAAGAATLDLQALAVPVTGETRNFDTLKVQIFYCKSAADNTATLTIADGASNGYNIFGDASGQVTLPIGGQIMLFGNDGLDDVAAADSEIDFSSGDVDATVDVIMLAG